MIISRTPLRMSFVGGGSDLPSFYRRHGGAVVTSTIDKYVYVTLNKKFDDGLRIAYSRTEDVANLDEVQHPLVRHGLAVAGLTSGIEITTVADVPSRGTGLGSSSAFTVGLLLAAATFQGRHFSPNQLGALSSHVEIDLCGEPIGKQDQYASAFGGLNYIEFHPDDRVTVAPIAMPPGLQAQWQARLLLFYTGTLRSASAILKDQNIATQTDAEARKTLQAMVELAKHMRVDLEAGALDRLGPALHENWILKKTLAAGISMPAIDRAYAKAREAGATGGKLLGAGGGGFLLFDADPALHADIKSALAPLRHVPFQFEPSGSSIVFNQV